VNLLEIRELSFSYGRDPALEDVSFAAREGEFVGLVGPNGAGKSTTLRIVCGLLRPDAGIVMLDGIGQHQHPTRFRSRLGALIEAPACYPSLTAFDHMAYLARLRGSFDRAVLEHVLEEVGLPPRSRKPVRQFSLGMKQRLGIAMATIGAPALLVLDEPMNGLDPLSMADLREALRSRAASDGVSILVSSHLLHEIEQICHRVLFIRDSRLISEEVLGREAARTDATVVVVTGDDAAAVELLRRENCVREAELASEGVVCRLAAGDVPEIARVLVRAGVPVHAITPRRGTLEDVYRSHYGGASRGNIQ
jgi:ABC-2 type transport system ATP-binding protein